MTIEAKVIEDSVAPHGVRLTTMQLRYPRFIHAEFMTHRVFSRNASSSRAIPVAKMIEQVRTEPAMPIHWGMNQAGMQAHAEIADIEHAKRQWKLAANEAADWAEYMMRMGLHKQVTNRILEPFQHISVIVTATEWANFFELRDHPDAQPEIAELARQMKSAMQRSWPFDKPPMGETDVWSWHLPYITTQERQRHTFDPRLLAQASAARCARVSYLTHDGAEPQFDKDLALYDRLVGSRPLHASPVEHQAFPLPMNSEWDRNFRGWRQHRTLVEEEFAELATTEA